MFDKLLKGGGLMKRHVLFGLILMMILGAFIFSPAWVQTVSAETVNYDVTGGQIVFDMMTGSIVGYTGSPTEIVVPDTIQGVTVTSIDSRAFFFKCYSLTSITLPKSLTAIGEKAFEPCGGLTNIIVDSENPYFASQNGILYNKMFI